jgi:hypothetical protein
MLTNTDLVRTRYGQGIGKTLCKFCDFLSLFYNRFVLLYFYLNIFVFNKVKQC